MPFDRQQADIAINFFERLLKHSGEWYGEPFLLTPWQEQAVSEIFGRVDDDGARLIKQVYLEVPKKTGKTEFAAGLLLLFLVLEKTHGCEVYGAASGQRQALNVYRAATAMVEQELELSKRLRILRSTHRIIKRSDPNSFYAAIAADGDFSDGVQPKFVVADEIHRWKTRKQMENWDVLRLGGTFRKQQALTIAITTAGVKAESPLAWRLHEKTLRIAEGVIQDPTFYGRIYAADPKDDWTDEETWIQANPSLKQNGGFLDISRIRAEYDASLSDPESQVSFRRYFLNLWDEKANRAIDMRQWDACKGGWEARGLQEKAPEDVVRPLHREEFARFVDRRCWAGVDLSFSTDLSAVTLVFPPDEADGAWEILPFFWMPAANIRKRELKDGMPYRAWVDQGFIEACPGNAIDNAAVKVRTLWASRVFDLREVCLDRYNSRELSVDLVTNHGLVCHEIPQTYALSEPTKKLLALIQTGKLAHGGHPVLRFNASSLCTKSDGNDNIRPVKPDREKETSRIDGLTAAITAMGRAIEGAGGSIYDTRGVLTA